MTREDGERWQFVRRWRKALDWSQKQLAERAGIDRGYLSRLEHGKYENPGVMILVRLARAFDRPLIELLREADLVESTEHLLADEQAMADYLIRELDRRLRTVPTPERRLIQEMIDAIWRYYRQRPANRQLV